MPGPVAHIVFAQRIEEEIKSSRELKQVILGSCWPDIRYYAGLSRAATHPDEIELDDIHNKSDFDYGVSGHLILDQYLNQLIWNESELKNLPVKRSNMAIKFVLDQVLLSEISKKKKLVEWFTSSEVLGDALKVDKRVVSQWYGLIAEFISREISSETVRAFLSKLKLLDEVSEEVGKYFVMMEGDDILRRKIESWFEESVNSYLERLS